MLLRVLKCIRIVSHVVELGRCTAVQVLINHNNTILVMRKPRQIEMSKKDNGTSVSCAIKKQPYTSTGLART